LFNIRSDNNEPTGWNAVRSTINVSNVVRTDNVTVTITLPALSSYSVVENENLTVKAPAIALANQVLLQAPEKPIIYKDNIYSTEAIVTTSASTIAPNVPEILVSNEAVGNWIRINAPSGLEQADQPNLSDAAYHQTLQRWAVVGWNAAGPQINNCVVLTADDIDDSAAWVERSLPTATNSKNGKTIIYDEVTDSFFAGGDSFLMFSPNGINWTMGSLPTTLSSDTVLKFSRAPQGGGGTTPRLYAVFSGSKKVARSANLASSPLTTTWEDLGAATTSGTALTAIASGTGLVFVANNAANAEIGYFIQGGTSYTEIGDLGMDVSDMAYGNGRLVCISANGRIQYGDAPSDLLTIGNWSAVSGAIDSAGTRDLAKIAYDGGGDGRIGYGFIATLSASGAPGDYVVYTSPDAVTWTLQSTVSDTSDALGIGTKYPQADLGEAPGIVITLSGESYYAYALTAPDAKFIVKADGTIHRQKNASTSVQIDALTDWIQPNYFANGTYDVRVTDVVWLRGSTWQASPGADGSWFALSSDRTWSVQDGHVRFKFEIRKDAGATLASATYILGSEQYIDPRGDDDDGGFIEP
jgi:hypothetical protein